MMWIAIGLAAAVVASGVGAFAAFVWHRREKATRPPHAHDRGMWGGT